jgi:hypothetical protein
MSNLVGVGCWRPGCPSVVSRNVNGEMLCPWHERHAGVRPRKKPTHGGARPNAGRPASTGMASTPPIHYRVSRAQYAELKAEGRTSKPRLTANAVAKRRAFPAPLGETKGTP